MSKSWARTGETYEIETDVYNGPLDLLLDLIQKAELDITKLAIATVTDQFLSYVEQKQQKDPENISEFLVLASRLIQIKSEALLPRPAVIQDDSEEDLGEALARQLILYREVKKATAWMTDRVERGLQGFLHIPRSYPVNVQLDLTGVTLTDLISALENIATRDAVLPEGGSISIPKMTLRKKVDEIVHLLRLEKVTNFADLTAENPGRLNRIVIFLAILELIKQDLVETEQTATFANITITANERLNSERDEEITIEDN